MRVHNQARQEAEWQVLHDRITETLNRFGKKDAFGRGDYWLVDENLGGYRQRLEVQNLNLLQPHIIKALQALLDGYPDWEIMFRVDVLGKENVWPAMGLVIHDDGIIDGLRREFLPDEFRNLVFEDSR
jgi:hypothetical protein